jgi:hypothetical protein
MDTELIAFAKTGMFWLGLWAATFRSPFVQTIMEKFVTKEAMTRDDVENYLVMSGKFNLLTLWLCPWCQAFWVSLANAITCALIFNNAGFVMGLASVPVNTFAFYPIFLLAIFHYWKK